MLEDNTAWFEGRVAVPVDQADRGPLWFPTGKRVAVFDNCAFTIQDDRPLDDGERLCVGATN